MIIMILFIFPHQAYFLKCIYSQISPRTSTRFSDMLRNMSTGGRCYLLAITPQKKQNCCFVLVCCKKKERKRKSTFFQRNITYTLNIPSFMRRPIYFLLLWTCVLSCRLLSAQLYCPPMAVEGTASCFCNCARCHGMTSR